MKAGQGRLRTALALLSLLAAATASYAAEAGWLSLGLLAGTEDKYRMEIRNHDLSASCLLPWGSGASGRSVDTALIAGALVLENGDDTEAGASLGPGVSLHHGGLMPAMGAGGPLRLPEGGFPLAP